MGRTSITVDDEAYDSLAALKREGESWSELFERAANALESCEGGASPEDVSTLTVDHIDDIGAEVERRMERVLENATRR